MRFRRGPEDAARAIQAGDGAAFVAAHQARVARHIRHQDGRQALPDLGLAQRNLRNRCHDPGPIAHCRRFRGRADDAAPADRLQLPLRRHSFQSAPTRSLPTFPFPSAFDWRPHTAGSRPMHWQYSMSFDSLGLAEPLLRAVREAGYTTPTPIQARAIPAVLSGGDVMGGAQTGTGKTAGFVLPMLQRLMDKPATRDAKGRLPIRALILDRKS